AGLLDLVALLASEVVTNAVLHGRDPVELLLNDDGTRLKVGCRPHSIAPGKIVWFELRYPVS
ncbi:MAG TPA: hypothetical protein VGL02_03650, partial [Streptomyces sp.]